MKVLKILLFIIVFNVTHAQENTSLKVRETQAYPETKSAKDIMAIHTDSDGNTITIRKGLRIVNIDVFDNNFKKTANRFIKISRKEEVIGEFYVNNTVNILTVFKPKKQTRIVNCYYFNNNKGYVEKKILFESTVEKKKNLFRAGNKRETNFAVSPNEKYFVINTDNIKKNINSYTVRVFNTETLELIYSKAYQTHEDKYFEPNDLFIDSDKNVYTLGKSFLKGKAQKKEKKANYRFVLNKINSETENTLDISLTDEHIQSLRINEFGNKFHLIGFYSNKKSFLVKGYCDFIIDTKNELKIIDKIKDELPQSVYDDLYGTSSDIRNNKRELSGYEIDHILTDSQGNSYIVSEEFYTTYRHMPMGQFGGTVGQFGGTMGQFGRAMRTVYHYDDIFVLKINPEGKLIWGRSIFKRANSPSYNVFLKNDELYVLLNSGKKLLKKQDGRTKVSQGFFESSALYNIIFKVNGDMVYEKIQNNKNKTNFLPFYGTYESNRFIMPNDTFNNRRFMILE